MEERLREQLGILADTLEMTLGVAGHGAECPYRLTASECQCWRAVVAQAVDQARALLEEGA